jgi:hypothetical protein
MSPVYEDSTASRRVLGVASEKVFDPAAAHAAVNPLVGGPPLKFCITGVCFDCADHVHELANVDAIRRLFRLFNCITGCHFISPEKLMSVTDCDRRRAC